MEISHVQSYKVLRKQIKIGGADSSDNVKKTVVEDFYEKHLKH